MTRPALSHPLRLCVLGLLLVLGALSAHAQDRVPGLGPTVPPPPPAMTVLVAGDSLASDLGVGLRQALSGRPQVTVINEGRAISGLVREDFFDWQAELPRLLDRHRVDVVVISIGMNDRQGITEGGQVHPRFTDGWGRIYAQRARALMTVATDRGIPVVWMGMPTARSRTFHGDMARINTIVEGVAAGVPGVWYLPMWPLTGDSAGNYVETARDAGGRARRLRADDGMHLTSFGVRVVVDAILAEMSRVLQVDLTR